MWLGYTKRQHGVQRARRLRAERTRFWVDEDGQRWRSFGNVCWFTNLDIAKRHEDLILYKTYNPERLPDLRQLRRHRGGRTARHPHGLRRASWACRSPSWTSTTPTSSRSWASAVATRHDGSLRQLVEASPRSGHRNAGRVTGRLPSTADRCDVGDAIVASTRASSFAARSSLMKIELKEITVRDLTEGYEDNDEQASSATPASSTSARPTSASSSTRTSSGTRSSTRVTQDFPLNVMYWAVRDDGDLRGHRRAAAHHLHLPVRRGRLRLRGPLLPQPSDDEQEQILDYR